MRTPFRIKKAPRKRSRGFTLVELLITIVIIGILAGAMMLLGGSAADKAKATKIVEEMRIMKSVAALYYSDFGSWPLWAFAGTYKNLDPGGNATLPDAYTDKLPENSSYWIGVMYGVDSATGETRVFTIMVDQGLSQQTKEKLAAMAAEMQFYAGSPKDFSGLHIYTAADNNIMWFM